MHRQITHFQDDIAKFLPCPFLCFQEAPPKAFSRQDKQQFRTIGGLIGLFLERTSEALCESERFSRCTFGKVWLVFVLADEDLRGVTN